MRRFLRLVILVGVVLFVFAQLIRPAKTNPQADQTLAIENQMKLDPRVDAILQRSCFDCHSNKTVWPWYSNVAPVSWFVINHVNEGRRDLNFSNWGNYDQRRKDRSLDQICEFVKGGAMPLSSYTPLHPNSKLTGDDVKVLCDWTNGARGQFTSMR